MVKNDQTTEITKPTPISDADFEIEVLKADLPVLVDFWAEWCGPCHVIAPVLDDLSVEYDGRVKFVKIDTEENYDVMSEYGIRGLPSLLVFKSGERVDQITGAVGKTQIKQSLEKILAE